MTTTIKAKRTEPLIPVSHPSYVWTPGADVQATWLRYGWAPPSAKRSVPEQSEGALQTSHL